MGSTGEPDRKRRHFSSISHTPTMAKQQTFTLSSEDKKLDTAVLQFKNQKLLQTLEAQKVEYNALENKFSLMKGKHQAYDSTSKAVNESYEALVTDLESHSKCLRESSIRQDFSQITVAKDEGSSSLEDAFLSRLMETGATESSSSDNCPDLMEVDRGSTASVRNILCNIVDAISDLWHLKDGLHAAVLKELPEDGMARRDVFSELETEVKNLRSVLNDLYLKHRSLARQLQDCQDIDAKNHAEVKYLKGELGTTVAELEDCNRKVAALKAERDATKGAFFPILSAGSKHVAGDKIRDKQKILQEMESSIKELSDQAMSCLQELKGVHEERIKILRHLSSLQNSSKNVKGVSSSKSFLLLRNQLEKSKSEVHQYRALFEKLQVEKDNLMWRERELSMKIELVDVFRRSSAVLESRIADLRTEIQKQIIERNKIETKLEGASKEPGRKEIIEEFKTLVSSFPKKMGSMQHQLNNYKEAAPDVHSLRADVRSLSNILDRKAKECENLSARSASQGAETLKLQSVVQYLRESELELKLILEMFQRESTDSRDGLEARYLEYKAWARVQSLKSSLDERNLELRVKTANEAEAMSQQRLAAAEAEVADQRQKLESSKRELFRLSDVLKSKNEENEAFLSEIERMLIEMIGQSGDAIKDFVAAETIGQAYEDMQTQNQHLLQQVTERDDYNIKLVLEGTKARQLQHSLLLEKQNMEKEIQQANISLDFYNVKARRIEDQLKNCSDQLHKFAEDKVQKSTSLEHMQKKLQEMKRSSNQAKESLENSQSKVGRSRGTLLELRVDLERERFEKGRVEEELEVARRKFSSLQMQAEASSVVDKLREELKEYRQIVKCSICLDRPKEVVITKCYHLFCSPCVQRISGSRHRKCPACGSSFGPNDVKPVYI